MRKFGLENDRRAFAYRTRLAFLLFDCWERTRRWSDGSTAKFANVWTQSPASWRNKILIPTMKRRDWYPCSACTMKEEGILYPTMDRLFSEQERAAMFSQMNIVSTSW